MFHSYSALAFNTIPVRKEIYSQTYRNGTIILFLLVLLYIYIYIYMYVYKVQDKQISQEGQPHSKIGIE